MQDVMDIYEDYASWKKENSHLIQTLVNKKSKAIVRFSCVIAAVDYLYHRHVDGKKLSEDEEVIFSTGFDYIYDSFMMIDNILQSDFNGDIDLMEGCSQTINLLLYINDFESEITSSGNEDLKKELKKLSNLDEDRLRKQREANDIFKEELDKREADIASLENQNAQIAAELAEREKNQEEREKTFNLTLKKYDDKNINVEQIAKNLNGMKPEAAVAILVAMDDQTVIDVLRKVEELAAANGSSSMGSYWLSLMPSDRAAEIQRKMISKPESLD